VLEPDQVTGEEGEEATAANDTWASLFFPKFPATSAKTRATSYQIQVGFGLGVYFIRFCSLMVNFIRFCSCMLKSGQT